jgi:hypothetical protein
MEEPPAPPPTSLLDLPDKALLSVLRCLAADRDLSSLFSAARARSTLHKLSTAALTSIDVEANQQQLDRLQLYLSRHGQHVSSLQLRGYADDFDDLGYFETLAYPVLNELPPSLDRLVLENLQLQLLPGGGRAGVLQAGASIKQLELCKCMLCDEPPDSTFAQALSQLPQLEHIKYANWGSFEDFPGHVLSALQQLTSLDVMQAPGDVLEFVHLVPRLRGLRASLKWTNSTSKLSALQHLTALQLEASVIARVRFSPADLANKSQLQHLQLERVTAAGGPAGVAELMSQLQQMTQLTHLELTGCWRLLEDLDEPVMQYDTRGPPAAAYAALTASNALQHLYLECNTMPAGVWQHVLPADRQLLQLRELCTSQCGTEGGWTHADSVRLVSCCPNLHKLCMHNQKPMAANVLQPLLSLTALTALKAGELDDAGFAAAAELTQLRQLRVWKQRSATDAGLLQLTQLRQLTSLGVFKGFSAGNRFEDKVRCDLTAMLFCSDCLRIARDEHIQLPACTAVHPQLLSCGWPAAGRFRDASHKLCRSVAPPLLGLLPCTHPISTAAGPVSSDTVHPLPSVCCLLQRPRDEPVWRQVLQHCIDSTQPGFGKLAQQAAASLEQLAL